MQTHVAKVKIVVGFYQVLAQFKLVFTIEYPPIFQNFLLGLWVFQESIFSHLPLSCISEMSHGARLIGTTLAVLSSLAALAVLYQCTKRAAHARKALIRALKAWQPLPRKPFTVWLHDAA